MTVEKMAMTRRFQLSRHGCEVSQDGMLLPSLRARRTVGREVKRNSPEASIVLDESGKQGSDRRPTEGAHSICKRHAQ